MQDWSRSVLASGLKAHLNLSRTNSVREGTATPAVTLSARGDTQAGIELEATGREGEHVHSVPPEAQNRSSTIRLKYERPLLRESAGQSQEQFAPGKDQGI